MAEYIEREKAIRKALDACVKVVGHGISQIDAMDIVDAMESIPTADVVPVVRCKNCKYFEIDEGDELGECKCGYISLSYSGLLYPHRTDFCNYGERKN